jgi:SAM-dependent methyltransferase
MLTWCFMVLLVRGGRPRALGRNSRSRVGGPFDLAYTRLFLMHQPDPVRTLRQIAGLLRPGGWLVAQEVSGPFFLDLTLRKPVAL